jgi:hypothetical protein
MGNIVDYVKASAAEPKVGKPSVVARSELMMGAD